MKQLLTFFLFFFSLILYGQEYHFTDNEIKIKLDSIKKEGNLLFSLENASWHSTDITRENKKIRELVGGYLTYKTKNDTVKTIFLNKEGNKVLVEYSFINNSKKPSKQNQNIRDLNADEIDLKNVREKVISQLSDPKYEVGAPEGFKLNLISIPFGDKYKTYIITGASEAGVIPFGNDYLFISDKEGKIIENKKFHSRLIPTYSSSGNMGEVTISTHSHLKSNPFISATDICTFKLYAPFTKLEKFSVYSPALSTYFEYNFKTDTLEKVKSPL